MVLRTRRVSFLLGMLFVLLMGATLYIGLWAAPLFQKDELMVVQRRLDLNRILQGDPGMFWTNRPNLKGELFESQSEGCGNAFSVTTNALGMRGPAVGEKGDRLRILAIGDSTTFGQYLEDRETWPAVLQSLLDAEGARAEVLNAGVIGMSSFQGLAYLMARGFDLQPDVVIATFGFNDRSPWDLRDREIAPLFGRSRAGGQLLKMLQGMSARARPSQDAIQTRVTPGEFLDILIAMAKTCSARGVRLYLNLWPVPEQAAGSGVDEHAPLTYQSLIAEAAKWEPAGVIDLRRPFSESPEPVFCDGVHNTPAGARVVAETVHRRLREDGLPAR